jgi:hypothetical protein
VAGGRGAGACSYELLPAEQVKAGWLLVGLALASNSNSNPQAAGGRAFGVGI